MTYNLAKRALAFSFFCLMIQGAAVSPASAQPDASTDREVKYGGYPTNRLWDLMDIATFKIGVPKRMRAFGIHVRATGLLQLGGVYFNGTQTGMDRRAVGKWRERRLQGALGPIAATRIETRTQHGNYFAYADAPWNLEKERGLIRTGEFWDDGRRHFFSFGLEIQPGLIPGFELKFDPQETIDYLFGFVGFDLMDDDLSTTTRVRAMWYFKPASDDPEEIEKWGKDNMRPYISPNKTFFRSQAPSGKAVEPKPSPPVQAPTSDKPPSVEIPFDQSDPDTEKTVELDPDNADEDEVDDEDAEEEDDTEEEDGEMPSSMIIREAPRKVEIASAVEIPPVDLDSYRSTEQESSPETVEAPQSKQSSRPSVLKRIGGWFGSGFGIRGSR